MRQCGSGSLTYIPQVPVLQRSALVQAQPAAGKAKRIVW